MCYNVTECVTNDQRVTGGVFTVLPEKKEKRFPPREGGEAPPHHISLFYRHVRDSNNTINSNDLTISDNNDALVVNAANTVEN